MADELLRVWVAREKAVVVRGQQPACEVTADVRLNGPAEVAFEDAAGRVRLQALSAQTDTAQIAR